MQDLYSHFQERIPSNSSIFTVANPNKYRDGVKRVYSFKYLNIVPEYFSMLATQNNMDDEDKNPIITRHIFKFEIKFKHNYYANNLFEYTVPNGEYKLSELTKKLNTEIDRARANSMKYPPVVFDWVDEYILGFSERKRTAINKYINEGYDAIYKLAFVEPADEDGEEEEEEAVSTFKRETHDNVLPASARSMPNCNNFLFPDEPEAIEYSRVRIIIAPNTKLSFSNEHVLNALGFTPNNYGVRGAQQRFHLENKNPDACLEVIAENPPDYDLNVVVDKTSKIYISVAQPSSVFSAVLTTTKFKEKRPTLLLKDLEGFLNKVSEKCYISFKITYVNKKFTFQLSDDSFTETKIYIPNTILERTGFQNSIVTTTNKTSEVIEQEQLDTAKYMGLSKILTYDTCHVIVTLAGTPAMTSFGQSEQMMAALIPKDDMLQMVKDVCPRVLLPENDQYLSFKIYRQSESKKMIQLGWPIDCYVYGMLLGQPINVK